MGDLAICLSFCVHRWDIHQCPIYSYHRCSNSHPLHAHILSSYRRPFLCYYYAFSPSPPVVSSSMRVIKCALFVSAPCCRVAKSRSPPHNFCIASDSFHPRCCKTGSCCSTAALSVLLPFA